MDQWNTEGSECEFSYVKLKPMLSNTYTSTCSANCSQKVLLFSSQIVTFTEHDVNTLEEGIASWLAQKRLQPCSKKQLDTDIQCIGQRKLSERVFIEGMPPLLPLEVANCSFPIPHRLTLSKEDIAQWPSHMEMVAIFVPICASEGKGTCMMD